MSIFRSFFCALRGLVQVWREERNFKIHMFAALAVVVLMLILPLKAWEYIVLTLTIALVLILEISNTITERFVDMVKPRLHGYVGAIKDMMAGAVLIMSIAAAVVGVIIFFPHLAPFVIQY